MRNALFILALLVSAFVLPRTAHADTIDDFTLTGDGHTITYSLPATSSYLDFSLFNFFSESAPTTIDGVSGYSTTGFYYVIGFPDLRMVLDVPDSIFGTSTLEFAGPVFYTVDFVPATNPYPYLPYDVVPTFTPGTYTLPLISFGSPSPIDYILTITPEAASTPEPSTFALLLTGLLGTVGSYRAKQTH